MFAVPDSRITVLSLLLMLATTLVAGSEGPIPNFEARLVAEPLPGMARIRNYEYSIKRDNTPIEHLPSSLSGHSDAPKWKGKRYRFIGIELENTGDEEIEVRYQSKQFRKNKRTAVTVPPHEIVRKFEPLVEPKNRTVVVKFTAKRGKFEQEETLEFPEHGARRQPNEFIDLKRELEREDTERRRLKARQIHVSVHDDLEFAVEAHLMILARDGVMVYEGDTDEEGNWSGWVMPGSYDIYALAEVPDRTDYDASTAVKQLPRLLVLRGQLDVEESQLHMKPERAVTVRVTDGAERPLVPERIWVTPKDLVAAFRYEKVAMEIGTRARVDSKRENPGGKFLVLTSEGLASRISARSVIDGTNAVLMTEDLSGKEHELAMSFHWQRYGRMVMDPATGIGPGQKAWVSLTALDGVREVIEFATEDLFSVYVPPGSYRTEIGYRIAGGSEVDFLPYRTQMEAGAIVDLTPRGPFDLPLYWKRDGKRVSFFLGIVDVFGRVLMNPPEGGHIKGIWRDDTYIDRELTSLRFEYSEGFERVDLNKIEYYAQIPFGLDPIEAQPHLERTTVYNESAQSTDAPLCLGDRAQQLLPEVKRCIDSSWATLGRPDGVRQLHMEYVVFLVPGVGGQASGSRITMENRALHHFTGATDLLPGPFRHEFGHVLGFGHGPDHYLASAGYDEVRFDSFGQRLLQSKNYQRTLDYIQGDRTKESGPWIPQDGIFEALRFLYGSDVHYKMLTEGKRSEQTLRLHGLSAIERMATLYSLVLEQNVAWVFRAHGWPVGDDRVDLGWRAINEIKKHPLQLNYARLDGTPFQTWWVYGPIFEDEKTEWRRVRWPSRFIRVNEDRAPSNETQKYLYFQRIKLPALTEARLTCASDVGLEIRVNGEALFRQDPSPQLWQPIHDEVSLHQKYGYPIRLWPGENTIEVAVSQPPGTRGFYIELLDPKGKAVRLAMDDSPPDAAPNAETKPYRLGFRTPVHNGSFELDGRPDTRDVALGWMQGSVDPRGSLDIALDEEESFDGTRSLRFTLKEASKGGVVHRIVVDPAKKYLFSAALKTKDLDGETYVCLFNNDIHVQFGKTEPIRTDTEWTEYDAQYMSGITRVIYLACYVKGRKGTVWFDKIDMVEIP